MHLSQMPLAHRLVRRLPTAVCQVFLLIGCSGGSATDPPLPAGTTTITFPGATLTAEIAASTTAREQGLMGRAALGADKGMLFVYAADQSPQFVGFYMKDTPIDLSIAFLDANRTVINVDEMTKNTLITHVAKANFRYAIEANAGWFTLHGVAAGTTANFALPAGTVISP